MTKASDNAYPSILITEGTEPSAPAAGKQRLYIDSTTHKLKRTDSSGTDVTIEGGSDPTSNRGEIIRRGAAALEALQAKTAGKVLVGDGTDVISDYPPGYELSYVEFTSSVSVTHTSEATADVCATAASVTYDGTPVMIEAWAPFATASPGGTRILIAVLWDDTAGASIGKSSVQSNPQAAVDEYYGAFGFRRRITPAAGARVYSFRAYSSTGTATVVGGTGGVGNYIPGFIRITKV